MDNIYFESESELMHHGVLGMKWGHHKANGLSVAASKRRKDAKTVRKISNKNAAKAKKLNNKIERSKHKEKSIYRKSLEHFVKNRIEIAKGRATLNAMTAMTIGSMYLNWGGKQILKEKAANKGKQMVERLLNEKAARDNRKSEQLIRAINNYKK